MTTIRKRGVDTFYKTPTKTITSTGKSVTVNGQTIYLRDSPEPLKPGETAESRIQSSGYALRSSPTSTGSGSTIQTQTVVGLGGRVEVEGRKYIGQAYIPHLGMTANQYVILARRRAVETGMVKKGQQGKYSYTIQTQQPSEEREEKKYFTSRSFYQERAGQPAGIQWYLSDESGKIIRKATPEEAGQLKGEATGVLQASEETTFQKAQRQAGNVVRKTGITDIYVEANRNLARTITQPAFNYLEKQGVTIDAISKVATFNFATPKIAPLSQFQLGVVSGILQDVRDNPLKQGLLFGAGHVYATVSTVIGFGGGTISKILGLGYAGSTIYSAASTGNYYQAGKIIGVSGKDIALIGYGSTKGSKFGGRILERIKEPPRVTFVSFDQGTVKVGKTGLEAIKTTTGFKYGKEEGIATAYTFQRGDVSTTIVAGTKGILGYQFPTGKLTAKKLNIFGGYQRSVSAPGQLKFSKDVGWGTVKKVYDVDFSFGSGETAGIFGSKAYRTVFNIPSGKITKVPRTVYSDIFRSFAISTKGQDKVIFGVTTTPTQPTFRGYGGFAFKLRNIADTNIGGKTFGKTSSPAYFKKLYSGDQATLQQFKTNLPALPKNNVLGDITAVISRTEVPSAQTLPKLLPSIPYEKTPVFTKPNSLTHAYESMNPTNKDLNNLGIGTSTITKTIGRTGSRKRTDQGLRISDILATDQRTSAISRTNTRTSEFNRILSKVTQRIGQPSRTPNTLQTVFTIPKQTTPQITPNFIVREKFRFFRPPSKYKPIFSLRNIFGRYKLFVKEKGQLKLKGTFKDPFKASAAGQKITGKTILRSYKVEGGRIPLPYGYRISKKKGQKDVFVELSKTALSQIGEQRTVQSRRKKGSKKKR